MNKRKGLMVTGSFPCVRVGKITEAMNNRGWVHDVVAGRFPPQFEHVYNDIRIVTGAYEDKLSEAISKSDAEIIHVNNEPNWPVKIAKEASNGRPVILNVHDVTSARPRQNFDPYEEEAYKYADAFIFVTEQQRQFAISCGFPIEGKPYAVIGNYASGSYFLDKPRLPRLGGVVYEGGLCTRGKADRWRDQSEIADLFESEGVHFHIYSDTKVDYGTQHQVETNFPILVHRLAQHDWGFCGVPEANNAWEYTIPNKFFDYMSAGIPVIAMNTPSVKPFCEMGFGVYVNTIEEALVVAKTVDPRPFRKAVMNGRDRFTMLNHIDPIVKLYGELT